MDSCKICRREVGRSLKFTTRQPNDNVIGHTAQYFYATLIIFNLHI